MEAHHHSHVEKKKFKDYLLEGLMIFVAVTLSFLAESLREHINSNEKENKYVTSLIHNLEQNEIDLASTIRDNQKKLAALDTLFSLASKDITNPVSKQLLYKYSPWVTFYSSFSSNDATIIQLKNAGGLQYIKHDHVADSIARYDEQIRYINAAEVPYAKAIDNATNAMSELISFKVWNDITYVKNKNFAGEDLPLLNNDAKTTDLFFNKIFIERGWTQNYVRNLQEKLPYTIRLTKLLKEEYKID